MFSPRGRNGLKYIFTTLIDAAWQLPCLFVLIHHVILCAHCGGLFGLKPHPRLHLGVSSLHYTSVSNSCPRYTGSLDCYFPEFKVVLNHRSMILAQHLSSSAPKVSAHSHSISAFILGPVFGNQDHFVGLAIFLDTFRNDLHGMDVSVQGGWPDLWPLTFSLQAPSFPTMQCSTGWPCL
jgi:hypothetical protein